MKNNILITGANGFIGKIITPLLSDKNNLFLTHRKKEEDFIFLDLLDLKSIEKKLNSIKPNIIIHLAAITHIDNCEDDKINGVNGLVWKTNVLATKEIVKYCKKSDCHLIYLSTESVFDGKIGNYKESDKKKPISWYGTTKSKAEDLVSTLKKMSILRAVISYYENDSKASIYGKILERLKKGKEVNAVYDQIITPTYVLDIGKTLIEIISHKKFGIFHLSPNKKTSPYKFAKWIAQTNDFDTKLINPISLEKFFGKQKSKLRLKNATLDNKQTLKRLGIDFIDFNDILL